MKQVAASPDLTVGELGEDKFRQKLVGDGLGVRIGPFDAHITADAEMLFEPLYKFYRDYPLLLGPRVFSFHAGLHERRSLLPYKRLVRFSVDGRVPHEDLPAEQAFAVLEWGMNLVIAMRAQCFAMMHSAVVERHGKAMLLPAVPGDGKTTLCAGMVNRGWRLLSDEFGLIRPETNKVVPIPRPMPLKNESIEVIKAFAPNAEFGPFIPNTRKGDVAHVKPTRDSIAKAGDDAKAAWIVFPRWVENASLSLQEMSGAEGFILLASNSFNYELLGESGFNTVKHLVSGSRCFRLVYSNLEEAVARLTELADEDE
jgi:HprK-related kinase A